MRIAATFVLMIAFTLVADAQGDKAAAKFNGTWTVVSRNDKKPDNRTWTFKDGKITDKRGDKATDGKVKIDAAKKHIDLIGDTAAVAGIYEFSEGGKKLTICGADVPEGKKAEDVRPTKIEARKGVIVWVLEKAK